MRLGDIEKRLKPAILNYIREVYPTTKGDLPDIHVLDDEQFIRVASEPHTEDFLRGPLAEYWRGFFLKAEGCFSATNNILSFHGYPSRNAVAHEIEHWAQAQFLGAEEFERRKTDETARQLLDASADKVASANESKLKWDKEVKHA